MSDLDSSASPRPAGIPFSEASGSAVRVRFCPSPTGTPHVGLIRTALFNWAYARHTGGTFVFRIEDTDADRDSEESYHQIVDALRWLRLDWDEGIDVGGPHAPYRQSERAEIYRDVARRLLEAGHLYESYSTAEEIDARNEAAGRAKQLGYDNYDRDLTPEQIAAYRAEGRQPALRLRVPHIALTFDDLVRGEVTFPAGSFQDFVVVRPNGVPLYTFVNPIDDALMGITHVLRGEDLLSSTPRQIALYLALLDIGVAQFVPRFGHLPYVMGEGNKKLSKRDPESNLFHHRDNGFIPEGLNNYLALLGWSLSHDRDVFSMSEMTSAFDVADVNPNPARFDVKKALSINGDHIRMLDTGDFVDRLLPYLVAAGVVREPLDEKQRRILAAAAPLVQSRVNVLSEAARMMRFLFESSAELQIEADALASLPSNAGVVVAASVNALELIPEQEWSVQSVQTALTGALVDDMDLKPRVAFGPVRVAVSGARVSPPLFESLEILGKAETVARLSRFATTIADAHRD